MNTHILLIAVLFAFSFTACNKKKKEVKKPQVQVEVVKPPVAEPEPLPEPEPIPEPEPMPDNKYFLIAASYQYESQAVKYRDELIGQGYDSEVIVRNRGLNSEYFRVSYKGFYDRQEVLGFGDFDRLVPTSKSAAV